MNNDVAIKLKAAGDCVDKLSALNDAYYAYLESMKAANEKDAPIPHSLVATAGIMQDCIRSSIKDIGRTLNEIREEIQ